jgi:hypothetical protein
VAGDQGEHSTPSPVQKALAARTNASSGSHTRPRRAAPSAAVSVAHEADETMSHNSVAFAASRNGPRQK